LTGGIPAAGAAAASRVRFDGGVHADEQPSAPHIVVLSGPPGSGKSTVARALAGRWPRAVHLHTDDFYRWIVSGYVAPWRPEAREQNVVAAEAMALAAERFADGGYAVVVDGVVGPWFLDPWRARRAPVSFVVLRPSLEATEQRARARGDHPLQDLSVVAQMHRAFQGLGPLEPHAIDSTDMTVEATTREVVRRLADGTARLT
jgi:predicted kinase